MDFSATAVEKARALASRAELDVEFVHPDVLNLPENLYGRFDVAVATYGIFTWIGDLQAWADNAAATLRPGGRLVVGDLHPLAQMIETLEPLVVDFPYTDDGPHTPVAATPATPPPTSPWPRVTVQWAHSVSELVTAFARAGLHVTTVEEHLASDVNYRPDVLTHAPDGQWHLDVRGRPLPVLLAITATK